MSGRPSTLTPEVIELAWSYVDQYDEYEHAVPSVVGLCKVINRAKSTVYKWAEDDDNPFSDILRAINENQELVTFNKSLTGEYNAAIAKLLLGKHGYSDKHDHTSSDKSMSPPEVIEVVRVKNSPD